MGLVSSSFNVTYAFLAVDIKTKIVHIPLKYFKLLSENSVKSYCHILVTTPHRSVAKNTLSFPILQFSLQSIHFRSLFYFILMLWTFIQK